MRIIPSRLFSFLSEIDFFKIKKDYPVLILDVENIDFVKDISAFNKMVELINNDYSNQVHRFKILP